MVLFQLVLVLLIASAFLTVMARKVGAPYPTLLAIAGAVLAAIPTGATSALDPELALALFVVPTLMDAAYETSPRDLRTAWVPVTGLVLAAVGLTVISVALVARQLVPGMVWSVAIVLGAIVAPPDSSSATAVLRAVSPPRRVMVILMGESLLNDASALLIYRVALGAATGDILTFWSASWLLILSSAGGVLFGWASAWLYAVVVRPIGNAAVAVIMQFVATFAVWICASHFGLSAVIATFAYGMGLARISPNRLDALRRRASFAVWEVAVFVLNALAFILIGLQLKTVLVRSSGHLLQTAAFAGTILLTVVAVRAIWVLGFAAFLRLLSRHVPVFRPHFGSSVVIAWCGMRGIVTLATALALPETSAGGREFPFRDLLIAAAFAVVFGTLVIQGLTLSPLIKRLGLRSDGTLRLEAELARTETARVASAALRTMTGLQAAALLEEYGSRPPQHDRDRLEAEMISIQRIRLLELRKEGAIGDDAYHRIIEDLDWAEVRIVTHRAVQTDKLYFSMPVPSLNCYIAPPA